MCAARKVPV